MKQDVDALKPLFRALHSGVMVPPLSVVHAAASLGMTLPGSLLSVFDDKGGSGSWNVVGLTDPGLVVITAATDRDPRAVKSLEARLIPVSQVRACRIEEITPLREWNSSQESLSEWHARWSIEIASGEIIHLPWIESDDVIDQHEQFAACILQALADDATAARQ